MPKTAKKRTFKLTIEDVNGKDYTFGGEDAAAINLILTTNTAGAYVPYNQVITFTDPNAKSDDNKGGLRSIALSCICTWYTHDHTSEDVDLPECEELCCLNQ